MKAIGQEVVAKAKTGDVAARDEVFKHYDVLIRTIAWREGHKVCEQDDCAQELRIAVLRCIKLCDLERGDFHTYLKTTLRHVAFNYWCSIKRRRDIVIEGIFEHSSLVSAQVTEVDLDVRRFIAWGQAQENINRQVINLTLQGLDSNAVGSRINTGGKVVRDRNGHIIKGNPNGIGGKAVRGRLDRIVRMAQEALT